MKHDINKMLLRAHRLGIRKAIETAARTNTALVVSRKGSIKMVKPKYRYVRVPVVRYLLETNSTKEKEN